MKIGIIGTGSIAEGGHLPAIKESNNAELTSILSRKKDTGEEFLKRNSLDNIKIHTTIDEFTSDPEIDFAIICSPDGLHMEHAEACMSSGKHVLIEKPMATSVADSEYLIEISKKNNVTLATGFHLRHHVGHIELLKKIHDENVLGEVRHVRAIWAWPQKDDSNWRARADIANGGHYQR